ncbi:MAG TPA: hypothetical protein VGH28_12570 [Polyangiaceae bacterium]|jgi:hypothetical protein
MKRLALFLFACACSSSPEVPTTDAGSDAPLADAPVTTDAAPATTNCAGRTPLAYDAPTDRDVHAEPTPPALGPAGSIVKDPTFGTPLVRITDDKTDSPSASYLVANEFWGNDWSLDSKYFYFQNGGLQFRAFDPKTLTATVVTPTKPLWNGGFSRTRPGVYIGMSEFTVVAYDFATSTESTIVDLTTIVPSPSGYALGAQEASNGLIVSAFGGPEQDEMPYIVAYDPQTKASHVLDVMSSTLDGKALPATIGAGVHVFNLDPSGAWVSFIVATSPQLTVYAWNVAAGAVTAIPLFQGNLNYGVLGWGSWLAATGTKDSFQFTQFDFASPGTAGPDLISPPRTPAENGVATSVSWWNVSTAKAAPFIVESLREPTNTNPWNTWDDEIIAVENAGASSRVWRFAHTFNTYTGTTYSDAFYYLFIPRVSQDGQFVLFDSNWNASLGMDAQAGQPRTDMFVAALPNECGP